MPKKKNATRKDGLVKVAVYLGIGDDGKPKYKTVYGRTQKEADEKAVAVKLSLKKGIDVSAARDTFGAWANRWIKVKACEVSAARQVVYAAHIKHLLRYLEYAEIGRIRSADIQKIIADLAAHNPNTGRPMAQATLTELKGTAGQIFRMAIDNRVLDYNPASSVRVPKARDPQAAPRALTDEEQRWINEMPHRAQRAAMLMMYAGLRRGELIALQWGDINLGERTITISKAVETVDDKFVVKKSAKTNAGKRVIDMPQRLVDFIRKEQRDSIFVCTSADNKMHTPSSWARMWESYLFDLNYAYGDFSPFQNKPKGKYSPAGVPFVIQRITPHMLRHTFCTMMYFAGVDILAAKTQMGHADIKTTLQMYTHLDSVHKRKSMLKLDEYLLGKSHDFLPTLSKLDGHILA